jgi:hypothetical protein
MNSHNTKSNSVTGNESARSVAEKDQARVFEPSSIDVNDLSISKDDNKGSDPYNSTGQHVIISSKIDLQD